MSLPRNLIILITALSIFSGRGLQAIPGSAPVPVGDAVYLFLERCAVRDIIPIHSITVKPLTRIQVGELLTVIAIDYSRLDHVLQADVDYYLREFAWDISSSSEFGEDPKRRMRSTRYNPEPALSEPHRHLSMKRGDDYSFIFDLIGQSRVDVGEDKTINRRTTGISFRGLFNKRLGYYFRFVDNTERGNAPYSYRTDLLEDQYGYVGPLQGGDQTYYDLTEATLSLAWNKVDVSFGKDKAAWGPTRSQGLLLSGAAPSYDQFRVTTQVMDDVRFVYLLGYLTSQGTPNDTLYQTGSGWTRLAKTHKWLAAHRLEYSPTDALTIAVNEAIVWGERGLDLAYLNPLNFLYSAEHNGADQDNILMSGDVTYRIGERGFMYAELLIDDLSISKLGTGFAGNKLGITAGALLSRCFLPGFEVGLEYTRLQPYVYSHFYPVNRYSNWTSSLGSSLRPNSDRLRWNSIYRWRRNVQINGHVDWNRRGDLGSDIGTGVPKEFSREISFLDDEREDWVSYEIALQWEPITQLIIKTGLVNNVRDSLLPNRKYLSLGYRY